LRENDQLIFYGETSLANTSHFHGKAIIFYKSDKRLFECWFVNNKIQGKARRISDSKNYYEGDHVNS